MDDVTAYLTKRRIRIFEFTQFAQPLTDAIKANAEAVPAANGLVIDYVCKKNFRKAHKVKGVLKERGSHPGVVWILSAIDDPSHGIDKLNETLRTGKRVIALGFKLKELVIIPELAQAYH